MQTVCKMIMQNQSVPILGEAGNHDLFLYQAFMHDWAHRIGAEEVNYAYIVAFIFSEK